MTEESKIVTFRYLRKNQIGIIAIYSFFALLFNWMFSFADPAIDPPIGTYFWVPVGKILLVWGPLLYAASRIPALLNPFFLDVSEKGITLRHYGFIPWENIEKIGIARIPLICGTLDMINFQYTLSDATKNKAPFMVQFLKGKYWRKKKKILVGFQLNAGINAGLGEICKTLERYCKKDWEKIFTDYDAVVKEFKNFTPPR